MSPIGSDPSCLDITWITLFHLRRTKGAKGAKEQRNNRATQSDGRTDDDGEGEDDSNTNGNELYSRHLCQTYASAFLYICICACLRDVWTTE
jgi:hypothetical protein